MNLKFVFAFAATLTSGCAELFLEERIHHATSDPISVTVKDGDSVPTLAATSVNMEQALAYAVSMSKAYQQAARNSAVAQDVTAGLLILAAASTALGAIDEVADDVLARRATGAVFVQQVGQRGLAADAIESLYLGARQANCVATIAALNVDSTDNRAGLLTVLVTKEIEYRIREGLVRDVPDFSSLQSAFGAISADNQQVALRADQRTIPLAEYLKALQGCLSVKKIEE